MLLLVYVVQKHGGASTQWTFLPLPHSLTCTHYYFRNLHYYPSPLASSPRSYNPARGLELYHRRHMRCFRGPRKHFQKTPKTLIKKSTRVAPPLARLRGGISLDEAKRRHREYRPSPQTPPSISYILFPLPNLPLPKPRNSHPTPPSYPRKIRWYFISLSANSHRAPLSFHFPVKVKPFRVFFYSTSIRTRSFLFHTL